MKFFDKGFFHKHENFGPFRLFVIVGSFELPNIILKDFQDKSVEISEVLS